MVWPCVHVLRTPPITTRNSIASQLKCAGKVLSVYEIRQPTSICKRLNVIEHMVILTALRLMDGRSIFMDIANTRTLQLIASITLVI
jgi:hypothetical protein